MVDRECGHLESVLVEHRRAAAGAWRRSRRRVDFHRQRLHLPVRRRHQRRAVMRDAVALVERVRLLEPVHHLLDARRPVYAQRMVAALRPRLEVGFAEIADVIGMKMREQHGGDLRRWNSPQAQVLPRARAHIHQVDFAAREDGRAGRRALAIGQRIPGPAQHHSQRVRREQVVARRSEGALDHAPKDRILHRRHMNQPPSNRSNHRNRSGHFQQSS